MALSTNSVFHFTQSIEAIKSILISNFRIKYCVETIEAKQRVITYAVPMASFCDIPLSQVITHVDKYGGYGIGLKKAWAKRKGLNPVLYLEKHSAILNDVLIKEKFENSGNRAVQGFLRFTKNYEGALYRNNKLVNKVYRFYDEREWRFCPDFEQLHDNELIIHDVEYYKEFKQLINQRLSDTRLAFTIRDITYIIVKDEEEIFDIIQHLESHLNKEKDLQYVKILTSKIMTSKQIRTDF
ncbi:abortive infection system antitoxin AbiGi family protein [Pedobacter deserti]|uniref:abortive infection system antitoxin AbiGi family protein n=1 Tax=Pedobacter deserti TaxID=2817382 RepID=UPI00210AB914|nr:abortive infection system antitoxin AbiGi family protein [Pedobacter sp. SYSU D00382]